MNKNEYYTLDITDITDTGMGIGHADNMAVFVKGGAVGDTLSVKITKVQKNIAFAIIDKIITPSSHRIEPDCPSFPACGGCVFRNIDYPFELSLKKKAVADVMHRIGKVEKEPTDILFSTPDFYRNKAQFPVKENGVGFYAFHSHRTVDCSSCKIVPEIFTKAANDFSRFLEKNKISVYNEETKTGLVRHFFLRAGAETGEVQAAVVINGDSMPKAETLVEVLRGVFGESLKSVVLNINKKPNNVILGDKNKTVYGKDYIFDYLCGVKVRLSVNSFYQVNHTAAEMLYNKVKEYAKSEGKTVLDLYCGAGTIGLALSKEAKSVIGVEIVEKAVEDARFNAKENGTKNARFICADAASAAKTLAYDKINSDIVVLDPPRKGCDKKLLFTVANDFSPERIVYVSCDRGTLARDVNVLSDLGYKLVEYTVVDMFPRTAHVETVCLLSRQ